MEHFPLLVRGARPGPKPFRRWQCGKAETLWAHFVHFRRAFTLYGIPEMLYTDGFTMFGHEGDRDLATKCGRMLLALSIAYWPCPPLKILDLHMTFHEARRVASANTVDHLGRVWRISPTLKKKVWLVIRPDLRVDLTRCYNQSLALLRLVNETGMRPPPIALRVQVDPVFKKAYNRG